MATAVVVGFVLGLVLIGGLGLSAGTPLPVWSNSPTMTPPFAGPALRPPASVGTPVSVAWPTYLYNSQRTGANFLERTISPSNVSQLSQLWTVPSNGSDFSSPIVVNGTVYFGSWNGYEYAVDASNGTVVWQKYLGTNDCGYTPQGVTSTPAYVNGTLYLGGGGGSGSGLSSYWYALNATNGSVDWKYQVAPSTENYFNWASALVYQSSLYIGTASCFDNPLIQGELREVNLTGNHTASHVFKAIPDGQIGNSIWSTPAVDPSTNTVWVTTGNENPPGYPRYSNSVIALNATTLNVTGWWQVPNVAGQDSDFGSTPTLFTSPSGIPEVVASNKNGIAYALNRSNVTGASWAPTWDLSTGGGFSSGAYDGQTLYLGGQALYAVNPTNGSVEWTASIGSITGALTWANGIVYAASGGDVYAVDAANGTVLWTGALPGGGSAVTEPVVADGRLYVASGDSGTEGNLTAFGLPFHGNASATPTVGNAPLVVNFTAAGQGGMTPYSAAWQFGDGTSGVGLTAQHAYSSSGNFSARVWVNDSAGDSTNVTIPVDVLPVVTDPNLTALLTPSTTAGVAPLHVVFSGGEQGGIYPPYNYSWTFGDGTVGAAATVGHTYSIAGNYTVQLQVSDRFGNTASAEVMEVVVAPLAAGAMANTSSSAPFRSIGFTSDVSHGLAPYSYSWNFGDGSPLVTSANPIHAYATVGNYTVELTVLDHLSERATSNVTLSIAYSSALLVGASYSFSGGSPCGHATGQPLEITYLGSASGGTLPLNYSWTFSDGSSAFGVSVVRNGSTLPSTATLTVTDEQGQVATVTIPVHAAASSCPTQPPLPSGTAGWVTPLIVGVLVVVILVAAGAAIWFVRRTPPKPPTR